MRSGSVSTLCLTSLVLAALAVSPAVVRAQDSVDARWIWLNVGNPAESAPAGTVWFRKEVKAAEPSTGLATVVSDDDFTLWVNGKQIGQGKGQKPYRFSLSGIVGRGTNVFALKVNNAEGKAGVLMDAEIRGQSGSRTPADTDATWKATSTAPQGAAWLDAGFDDKAWLAVKDLGPHAESPWKAITLSFGELDRFQVPDGFVLQKVATKELAGSLIAMTWGNRGRLLVSQERGPVLALTDEQNDGVYDKASVYCADVTSCQGLCQVRDDLFVVGNGPQGAGLYRLPDANHDDKADEVILLTKHKGGIGEHGPHDVVLGPDGWLYHNLGNHAAIENKPEATSPNRGFREDYLLEPKFEDAGGHAVGIKAPGGTIWRFTPDGKKWWMETNGFRNEYDIAFNSQGDLFTFDSDMEWDVNLPWYRPVRINHCVPGAEFGWRSGAAKWNPDNLDSLPAAIDVGRGSPTGVVFYEHSQFPEKYRGAMLNCDWSMGRLISAQFKRAGASFTGSFDNLVTGNPLNVSDVEVDRDGSVLYCTGGRGTEGGIYRVSYQSAERGKLPAAETVADALAMPQMQSNWAREACLAIKEKVGAEWETGLVAAAKTGKPAEKIRALTLLTLFGPRPTLELLTEVAKDADPSVRGFAIWLMPDAASENLAPQLARYLQDADPSVQRRACEAFVRSGLTASPSDLIKLLAHNDRFVRFAARIALERVSSDQWKTQILASSEPDVVFAGLYALTRVEGGLAAVGAKIQQFATEEAFRKLPLAKRIDLARIVQILLINDAKSEWLPAADRDVIGRHFLREFNRLVAEAAAVRPETADLTISLQRELSRVVAALNVPDSVPALLKGIAATKNREQQIHYALCLRYVKTGWNPEAQAKLLDWYETTRDWEGGNSLPGYIRNIIVATSEYFSPADRRRFLEAWKARPLSARALLSFTQPEQIEGFDSLLAILIPQFDAADSGNEYFGLTIEALSRSKSAASQTLLRKLFDEHADRRDLITRAMAKNPEPESLPYLSRGLSTGDETTLQLALQALGQLEGKTAKPADYRAAILAGMKLGDRGGQLAINLLQKWTGEAHKKGKDIGAALAYYRDWYAEKNPNLAPITIAKDDLDKAGYTKAQLVDLLEKQPVGKTGDVARGKAVFAKANCVKCHRFLNEGEGVGPDLTTLRRRFQRAEILDAVLYPSQVISDQYAAVTVVTTEGLTHTGMPLPNPGSDALLLLLPDATRLAIPKEKVDEKTVAKVSVMPEGLFKGLTPQEIADLFAFLETSKQNAEPAATKPKAGS